MEKTCRWTCGKFVMRLECDYYDRPAWACTSLCSHHEPRETPLLVDELGEALKNVWGGRFTDGDTSGQYPSGCERLGYTVLLTPEQCEIIQAALARYKEEVGDA